MLVSWEIIKSFCTARSLSMQWLDLGEAYAIRAYDGPFLLECTAEKGSTECIDFETNFKPAGNKKIEPRDGDGSVLQRAKITTTGWHYQLHGLEFTTSSLESVYSKKYEGTDYGFTTMKCYGADGVLITDPAIALTSTVKTIVDWEPTHDLEIVGGMVKQVAVPTVDIRLWVVGVPDIPVAYGGSKPFATNINMKYMGIEEGVRVDGRAPKYLPYSAVNHTTKLRLQFVHPAGHQHMILMVFELFKA